METSKAIAPAEQAKTKWFPIAIAVSIPLIVAWAYVVLRLLVQGHVILDPSDDIPWNIFVVIYIFGISSIGLCYMASFGTVLGIKRFNIISRRAIFLGILLIVASMLSIALDLGHPERIYNFALHLNPRSALGIVFLSLSTYLILMIGEFYVLTKYGHESGLLKVVSLVAFIAAVVVHSFHGAILGLSQAREFWQGPYYPIYFLLSALFASSSIIVLVTTITYKVTGQKMSAELEETLKLIGTSLLVYVIALSAFFLWWKMYVVYYFGKPEGQLVFSGPYKATFLFEVLIGYVIPFVLLLFWKPRTLNKMAFVSLLVLIGIFTDRFEFMSIGQAIPQQYKLLSGLESGYSFEVVHYTPNSMEIMFAIGLLGLILLGYSFGVKYLSLDKDEKE